MPKSAENTAGIATFLSRLAHPTIYNGHNTLSSDIVLRQNVDITTEHAATIILYLPLLVNDDYRVRLGGILLEYAYDGLPQPWRPSRDWSTILQIFG